MRTMTEAAARVRVLTAEHRALGTVQTRDPVIVAEFMHTSVQLAEALDELHVQCGCPAFPWAHPVMADVAPAAMERLGLLLWSGCMMGAMHSGERDKPHSAVLQLVQVQQMVSVLDTWNRAHPRSSGES